MQFFVVFEKFARAYLFQIALEIIWLPIRIVLHSVQLLLLIGHASDKSIESCSARPTIQQQFESSVIVSRFIAKQNLDQPSLAAVSLQAISSLAVTSLTAKKPAGLPAVDLQRKSFKCSRLHGWNFFFSPRNDFSMIWFFSWDWNTFLSIKSGFEQEVGKYELKAPSFRVFDLRAVTRVNFTWQPFKFWSN